jgi:hypothetical protein
VVDSQSYSLQIPSGGFLPEEKPKLPSQYWNWSRWEKCHCPASTGATRSLAKLV